ncbi:MAG: hypothetical protein IT534_02940 [Bauldia sp.]|nr:hypothetical protein [Bauldia sp.]
MLRFLALTAVLFIVPFAIHAFWIWAKERRWPTAADYPMGRVVAFSIVGAVLVLIGILWLVLSEGGIGDEGETAAAIVRTVTG